jgi:hypothetical protein
MSILANPLNDIPTKSSNDTAWINWLDECIGALGKSEGKQVWLKAWNNRGTDSANTSSLREYVKQYGIKIAATNPLGSIEDLAKDTIGGAIDTVGGFLKMGKIGTIVVGTTVLACVVILVIGISKHPQSFTEIMKPPVI